MSLLTHSLAIVLLGVIVDKRLECKLIAFCVCMNTLEYVCMT